MPLNHDWALYDRRRFDLEANRVYQVPTAIFDTVNLPMALYELAYKFIRHHEDQQVPRLKVLFNYYQAQSKIKRWPGSPNPLNAHNRVASAFARYITNIRVGYFMGNDIQFKVSDDAPENTATALDDLITSFNDQSNEPYNDEMIKKDLSITGRAYDLVYAKQGETTLRMAKVDPLTAFVVYDDSIDQNPLFAVRYYQTGVLDEDLSEQYEIYTTDRVLYFHTPGGLPQTNSPVDNAIFDREEPHFFGQVPLTEYWNNDERTGDWEAELDHLDALDMSVSTMANFQEDFNQAAIVTTGKFAKETDPVYQRDDKGNVVRGKDGQPVVLKAGHPDIDPHNRMFWLKPYIASTGIDGGRQLVMPSMQYLVKQYDANGWSTYTNFLINEIHKYTNTPNVNDPNFASNASGVAMSYKLWGSDQERKIQEALFKKSLHRRLLSCINYWLTANKLSGGDAESLAALVNPNFTPNLPKNDDATAQLIQILKATQAFSDETLQEMAEPITSVPADAEQKRMDDQTKHAADMLSQQQNGDFGIGNVFRTGRPANEPINPTGE